MELQFLFWDIVSVSEGTLDGTRKVSLAVVISNRSFSCPNIARNGLRARILLANFYKPLKNRIVFALASL